jgi:hypothetical protein
VPLCIDEPSEDERERGYGRELQVGERVAHGLGGEELVALVARHVCQREGYAGRFQPRLEIHQQEGLVTFVELTLERTG